MRGVAKTVASAYPLSEKWDYVLRNIRAPVFYTTIPESGNQNPHHTIFAGSQFSLATLTGWGLIWLLMQEHKLQRRYCAGGCAYSLSKTSLRSAVSRC